MSAVDNPEEKTPTSAEPAASAEIPRRSVFFRFFRAIRKSLEDDGLIGRVTKHYLYSTLCDLLMLFLVLSNFLNSAEPYIAKYTASSWNRFMLDSFNVPLKPGLLAQVLASDIVSNLQLGFILWFILDLGIWMVYRVLEKFTLEEHEVAERQYKKEKEQLGEVEVEEDEARPSLLAPIVNSRGFSWLQKAVFGYAMLSVLGEGYNLAQEIAQEVADYAPPATPQELALINPWRDLLPSQEGVLRDLIYIGHVLEDLSPSTLPDDDFQLYSDMIRSLETRTDISWRVFEETEIRNPIMHAANQKSNPEEPFFIRDRVKALFKHWDALAILPDKPQRHEDASDTTFIPPILRGRQIADGKGAPSGDSEGDDAGFKLSLTPEQNAQATKVYENWRRNRDHKVSYLKLHPPTPMAWTPVRMSDASARNAWADVFHDGKVQAGRHVADSKLVGNKKWKPMFRPLLIENIPFSWEAPGMPPIDWEKELEESTAKYERKNLRNFKTTEYQKALRERLDAEKVKEEL